MPAGGKQNSKDVLEFLGGLGSSDRGDDIKLGHTAKALIECGEFLIKKATANLQKKGHIATGETATSMHVANLQTQTTKMSLDVVLLSTYKFLDQGVRGTEGGAGKYAFKTKFPSKKMATALLKWIRTRSMKGRTKYKPKGAVEKKDVQLNKVVRSADNFKSLAYAVATNIKKKGIKKTSFFSDAIKDTKDFQKKKFAQAFKLDIIENLS